MAEVTKIQALKEFFGARKPEFREGRSETMDLMHELKALSDDEKQWLASEAAKALGNTLKG